MWTADEVENDEDKPWRSILDWSMVEEDEVRNFKVRWGDEKVRVSGLSCFRPRLDVHHVPRIIIAVAPTNANR